MGGGMTGWSTDIKSAPHGRYVVKQRREGVDQRVFVPERVILSTKCGKVVLSHYLPEEKRWLMLGKGEAPDAWMPWPEPYSNSHSVARNGANMENGDVDGSAPARTEASEDVVALTGQIESPIKAEIIDGNASLAAREGEKPLHSNSKFGPEAGAATPEALGANAQGGIPVGANASLSGVTGGERAAIVPHSLPPVQEATDTPEGTLLPPSGEPIIMKHQDISVGAA